MADYSISQLTEDVTAADSDLIEVSKANGNGTYTSRKQTRSTLLAGKADQADLDAHEANADNPHGVTKAQVGLSAVDNTSDANKPISTATQTALNTKVDKVAGKGLSTEDYTTVEKAKLAGIEAGAEVNDVWAADIAAFETTTQLNARDTANRARSNHTGTQPASTISDFATAADARIAAQKGQNSGLASLDSSGKVPTTQLPAIALTDVYSVANEAAHLALTAQEGDVAVRTDLNKSYVHNGGTAGTMADWTELLTPTDTVLSINGQTGAVSLDQDDVPDGATYKRYSQTEKTKLAGIASGATANSSDATLLNRTNHTGSQEISTVTGLQTALDGKAASSHTHDDRYYTETEIDTALALKADAADVPATIVESLVAGTNVTIDDTDPANPVISATGGGGGGAVDSVNGQTGAVVLDADDIDDGSTTNKFTTASDIAKLAGIESGATADMTGAEIKIAYEAEADTNAYTDAEKTKLAGVATGATANDTDANLKNRANHTGTQTASTISDFASATDARISSAAGSTIASLSGGKVPTSQLPAVSLTSVQTAADESAMLALTTQEGDVVVRTDENKTYMKNGGSSGTMSDFTLLNTPADAVTSVNSQTGAVVLGKSDVGLGSVPNVDATDRANHTGTQTASTISDFDTEVSNNTDVAANTAARHTHANSAVLDATTASFTTADETKLGGIEAGAQVNVSEINDAATTTTNTWSADKISTEIAAGGGGGSGVSSVAKSGETGLTGDVTLSGGTGITLTQTGNDIEIAYSGSGGGGGSSTPKIRFASVFEGSFYSGNNLEMRWIKATSGSGSISFASTGLNIGTGASSTSHAELTFRVLGGASYDGNIELFSAASSYLGGSGTQEQYHGVGDLAVSGTGITLTGKHFGWHSIRTGGSNTHSYSCADGTTQNSGTFIATGGTDTCYIQKKNSSIRYYYNGTLIGTLSANIPTGGTQYPFSASVSNDSTIGNLTFQLGSFEYTREIY